MSELVSDSLAVFQPRPVLDRALSGNAFKVDQLACAEAARVFKTFRAGLENELGPPAHDESLLKRICQAAICHQINWDFLGAQLVSAFASEQIDPEYLSQITASTVGRWLASYHQPNRIRATERAALLRDVGRVLLDQFAGKVEGVFDQAQPRLGGADGLLQRLDRFRAFGEDPLRKKRNVLIHELIREKVISPIDGQEVEPAIDYHIMRLYLRTGRVVPLDAEVAKLLEDDSAPRPRLITLLRRSVGEALTMTAFYANESVPLVNSFEWELGREVCTREQPSCLSIGSGCPNEVFCQAYRNRHYLRFREPSTKSRFY